MRVYHKRECRFNSTKSRACDWSTKRGVKIRRLNTSINWHSDTALFTALFAFTEKWERVNFKHCTRVKILLTPHQTVIFILTLIQCVLAFKYHIPLKLGVFYLATGGARACPNSFACYTFLGFLSSSLTTCVGVAGATLASTFVSDDECVCMGEG